MPLWLAILLTIALIIPAFFVPEGGVKFYYLFLVIITTGWVIQDSKKIEPQKYKSIVGQNRNNLSLFVVFFWPIAFPAYLNLRYKIKKGKAVLKETKKK